MKMEGEEGFEPIISRVRAGRSAVELFSYSLVALVRFELTLLRF